VFYQDPDHIYHAATLDRFEWLTHGFGTRRAKLPGVPLATLHQVHSTTCVAAAGRSGLLCEGDALLENTPGNAVAVKTADCIPMLFADARHRAVAAVHAGWRGTAGRIGPAALTAMKERFGTLPEDVHVAIGPGIGLCCYEVGPEVAARFGVDCGGRVHIDLSEANRSQLAGTGVPPGQIHIANLCTMCRAEEFYSFRRDKQHAGRMHSFIGVL
jgi:YfiH family protein